MPLLDMRLVTASETRTRRLGYALTWFHLPDTRSPVSAPTRARVDPDACRLGRVLTSAAAGEESEGTPFQLRVEPQLRRFGPHARTLKRTDADKRGPNPLRSRYTWMAADPDMSQRPSRH